MKPNYQDTHTTLYQGHALSVLKSMSDESVDMCMTSPPYWRLRAYRTDSQIWGGNSSCEHEWLDTKVKPINLQAGNPEFKRQWRDNATFRW